MAAQHQSANVFPLRSQAARQGTKAVTQDACGAIMGGVEPHHDGGGGASWGAGNNNAGYLFDADGVTLANAWHAYFEKVVGVVCLYTKHCNIEPCSTSIISTAPEGGKPGASQWTCRGWCYDRFVQSCTCCLAQSAT